MIGKVNGAADFSARISSPAVQAPAEQEAQKAAGAMPEVKKLSDTIQEFRNGKEDEKKDLKKLTEEDVGELSDALNQFMEKMHYDIRFNYRKELGRLTMKVVDQKTDEVIKEFPPEEMVDTLINIKEWIGVFLDKKA